MELRKTAAQINIYAGSNEKANAEFIAEGRAGIRQNKHKGESTLVTLPRIVTPYRDSVDGTRTRVTYQKLVTR